MIARKSGTILLTGGGFALSPSGEYLTLSIGKAGIRCMSRALFPEMAAHNVHIASLTVTRHIEPDTEEPREVADMFWNMHQQPAEAWTWEEKYP
jgi:Short-chain dehydrogenases of various substrate specificities